MSIDPQVIVEKCPELSGLALDQVKEIGKKFEESINSADAPLTTQAIIKAINDPHSRIRQQLNVFAAEAFLEIKTAEHNLLVQRLQFDQKILENPTNSTSSFKHTIDKEIIAETEPYCRNNKILLDLYEKQFSDLNKLYIKYNKKLAEINVMELRQRDEYNRTTDDLGLDSKYRLTAEKQQKIHGLYEDTEKRSSKLEQLKGVQSSEREKDHLNEIKYMRLQTEQEGRNLLPSEIAKLAKGKDASGKSLFGIVNDTEKNIIQEKKELSQLSTEIYEKEKELLNTSQEINGNTSHLNKTLMPNFSSAKNAEELQEQLETAYKSMEKSMSNSSIHPAIAFEYRLAAQLKEMSPEQQTTFFEQTKESPSLNENIRAAVNNLQIEHLEKDLEEESTEKNQKTNK